MTCDDIEVTLWQEHSESQIKTGDYVRIDNVSVGFYEQAKNLSTNQLSTIEVRLKILNQLNFQQCCFGF